MTIFYLPREIAVLPISWGELLIISIFSALICVYLRFMSISWCELLIISIFSALICVYLRFMSISWSLFVLIRG